MLKVALKSQYKWRQVLRSLRHGVADLGCNIRLSPLRHLHIRSSELWGPLIYDTSHSFYSLSPCSNTISTSDFYWSGYFMFVCRSCVRLPRAETTQWPDELLSKVRNGGKILITTPFTPTGEEEPVQSLDIRNKEILHHTPQLLHQSSFQTVNNNSQPGRRVVLITILPQCVSRATRSQWVSSRHSQVWSDTAADYGRGECWGDDEWGAPVSCLLPCLGHFCF